MDWRPSQEESRRQWLAAMDAEEAGHYDERVGRLSPEEEAAYLDELAKIPVWKQGDSILDAGAGTGTFCRLIRRLHQGPLIALEPSPTMAAWMDKHLAGARVQTRLGFCDSPGDTSLFPPGKFQAIVSRQLVNGLFDPLTAFGNWLEWLSPGGTVIVIDGIYGRSAWARIGEDKADQFPAASNQSLALVPYLLETAGFQVQKVSWMEGLNQLPGTRTPRYLVHAVKPLDA